MLLNEGDFVFKSTFLRYKRRQNRIHNFCFLKILCVILNTSYNIDFILKYKRDLCNLGLYAVMLGKKMKIYVDL